MPEDIRLDDEQFNYLIGNPDKAKKFYASMNEAERLKLRQLVEQRHATKPVEGEIAQQAQERLRTLKAAEAQPVETFPTAEGITTEEQITAPGLKEQATLGPLRARQERAGVSGGLIPPVSAEEAGGVTPQVALNIAQGPGMILSAMGHLGASGLNIAGLNVAEASATLLGDEEASQELAEKSNTQIKKLIDEVAGVYQAALVDIPTGTVNAALYEALPQMQPVFQQYGITPDKFQQYFTHDPVGTALFLAPWIKGVHASARASALQQARSQFQAQPVEAGKAIPPETLAAEEGRAMQKFEGEWAKFDDAVRKMEETLAEEKAARRKEGLPTHPMEIAENIGKLRDRNVLTAEPYEIQTDVGIRSKAANIARDFIAKSMGVDSHSPLAVDTSGRMGNFVNAMKDFYMTVKPKLTRLLSQDPKFYGLVEEHVSASHYAQVIGRYMHDDLIRIFSEDGRYKPNSGIVEQRMTTFVRYLNSEKSKGIKLRNAAEQARYESLRLRADELNRRAGEGENIPKKEWLTDKEKRFMKDHNRRLQEGIPDVAIPEMAVEIERAFMSDPTTEAALTYWRQKAQPFFESFMEDAGIPKLETPSGLFIKTVWYDNPKKIPKETKVRNVETGEAGPRSDVWKRTRTKARSGRRATGRERRGGLLSEDLRDIIHKTLVDRMVAASKRRMQEALIEADMSKTHKAGDIVPFGEGVTKLRRFELLYPKGRTGRVLMGKYRSGGDVMRLDLVVPEPLASAYEIAMQGTPIQRVPLLDTVSRYMTASALLIPAEATMHGLGVVHALYSTPGLGSQFRGGRAIAQIPVAGRMVSAIADMWSLEGKSFRQDVTTLSKHGALRTSHFERGVGARPELPFVEKVHHIPIIGQMLDIPREYVFGFPSKPGHTPKRGFRGMETRLRVAMLRALRHGDPTITDAKAANLINNQMGTYVSKLEPGLVSVIKGVDPFARAGVALTQTGLKSIIGRGPTGFSWEIAANTVTTGVAIALMVKWLDPEGRWPWDVGDKEGVPGLKPGDIPITLESGKRVDIPFRLIANNIYRGFNMTGIRTALESYLRGERDLEFVAMEQIRGISNGLFGRLGPPARAVVAGLTGQAPYQLPGGGFLPVEEPTTKHPLKARIKAAMKGLVPFVGKTIEGGAGELIPMLPESHRYTHPDGTIGKLLYILAKYTGFEPAIRPEGYDLRMRGVGSRGAKNRLDKVVWSIYYEMQNVKPEEQGDFMREQLETRVKEGERLYVARKLMSMRQNMQQRYIKSAVEQELREQGVEAPWGMVP